MVNKMSGLYAKNTVIENHLIKKVYTDIDEVSLKKYYQEILDNKINVAKIKSIETDESNNLTITQDFVKGRNIEEFVFFDAINNNKMTGKSFKLFSRFVKNYFDKIYPLKNISVDCKISNFMADNLALVDIVPAMFLSEYDENVNTIKYSCYNKDLQIRNVVVYWLKYYIKYAYKNSENRLLEIDKIFRKCVKIVEKYYKFRDKSKLNEIEKVYNKRFEMLENISNYNNFDEFVNEFLNNNFCSALNSGKNESDILQKANEDVDKKLIEPLTKSDYKGIYILGGTGAGKSYVTAKIKENTNYYPISLDKIYWTDNFLKHNDIETVKSTLSEEMQKNEKFIVEGSYLSDWVYTGFEKCDVILAIKMDYKLQRKRVIKRFIKRKLKLEYSSQKESIKSIKELLNWSKNYADKLDNFIAKSSEKYGDKIIIVDSSNDVLKHILMK